MSNWLNHRAFAWAALLLAGAACSSNSSSSPADTDLDSTGAATDASAGAHLDATVAVTLPSAVHVLAGSDPATADGTEAHPFSTVYAATTLIDAQTGWTGELIVHAGQYALATDVVLSARATLEVLPGAQFQLGDNISFHVQNDVKVVGTAAQPILFTWLVPNKHWGSFTNFEPTSTHNEVAYTIFEHSGESTFNGVGVRGAMSWRQAAGHIHHNECRFAEGDDCMAIRGSISIVEYNYFHDNYNDCIDSDLSATGQEIRYNYFVHCGNDAVDLGEGSTSYVHDNIMLGSGDKGLSIGETSFPTARHNIMVGCNIGIGVKDSSDPILEFNTLYKNNLGLAQYEAIAGLGGGKGVFRNGIIWGSFQADVARAAGSTVIEYSCIQSDVIAGSLTPEDGLPTIPLTGTGVITQTTGCPDPLFADPPIVPTPVPNYGTSLELGDLHLKSIAGRFVMDPASDIYHGVIAGSSVATDTVTSPGINAGDPTSLFDLEPAPNGGRADLGAYGDSPYASLSPATP